MSLSKMIMGQSGNQGAGAGLDVDELYSTFVYTGSNSDNNSIVNNINLSGKGGLVWIKQRGGTQDHQLFDTEGGVTKFLESNSTNEQDTNSETLTTFNSNGFILNNAASVNSAEEFVSWTFRKAPKFFDIVTYSGNSTNRTISHNLGTTVGFMVVKRTSGSGTNWMCFHRSVGATKGAILNGSNTFSADSTTWNNTAPTSSVFSLGTDANVNQTGHDYVAYLFAHNDNDGTFGPTGDQDIIKCGTYAGNGSNSGNPINVGFEPQWLLIKRVDFSAHWTLFDNMRGMPIGSASDASFLLASDNVGEDANFKLSATPVGFNPGSNESKTNNSGDDYIYVAIRRGPLAAPTSASQVFNTNPAVGASGNLGQHRSGFPVDFAMQKRTNATANWEAGARLIRHKGLRPNDTNEQDSATGFSFDYMDGWGTGSVDANRSSWMWKRAPKYFDVVTYTGTGSSLNVNHNLGVVPEMIWLKDTNNAYPWIVQGSAVSSDHSKRLELNDSTGLATTFGGITALSSTTFTVGTFNNINTSSANIIAFLFASVPGICKIGTYTGNGSTQTIDCGFSNGSKLVIIKRTDSDNTNWLLMDSVRGINAGNDPSLSINTSANIEELDLINPQSSGFEVEQEDSGSTNHRTNTTGGSYLFYAIAA